MKKAILAAVFIFLLPCRAISADLPKNSWLSENEIGINPVLFYGQTAIIPFSSSYGEWEAKTNIHLSLTRKSREIREYQTLLKDIKLVIDASVDCDIRYCRVFLNTKILKKKLFGFGYHIIYESEAAANIKPRDGEDDKSCYRFMEIKEVINPQDSHFKRYKLFLDGSLYRKESR